MAFLLRLIAFALLFSFSLGSASAAAPVMKWIYGGRLAPLYDTPEAACAASGEANVIALDQGVPNERYCLSGGYGVGRVGYGAFCLIAGQYSPAGGSTCPDSPGDGGLDPNDSKANFCSKHSAAASPFNSAGRTGADGQMPSSACYMPGGSWPPSQAAIGCVSNIGSSTRVPNGDGSYSWSAVVTLSGGTCTDPPATGGGSGAGGGSGDPLPPKADPNPCPSGFPGQVNGTTVCVPSVPDSGIGGTSSVVTKAPDGSSDTTSTDTKCNAGTCTTTTSTVKKNPAGEVVAVVPGNTVTQSVNSLCAKDPGNKVCAAVGLGNGANGGTGNGGSGNGSGGGGGGGGTGEGSSFGGTCAEGFKAKSEDAVVNAMAEETFRQNCKVNPDTDSQALGKAEAAKTGNLNKDNPNNGDFSIGPSNFDTTDAIGGGAACIADKTVTIMGGSLVLPMSIVCPYLNALGLVLLACSFLLAARIVTRG